MACLRKYDSDDYRIVKITWKKYGKDGFQAWAENVFLPKDVDSIVKALENKTFDKNFKSTFENTSPISGEVNSNGVSTEDGTIEDTIVNFKSAMMANPNVGNATYEQWIREFTREIISRTIFNLETGETFNPKVILPNGTNSVSANMMYFKNKLLRKIGEATGKKYELHIGDTDEIVTKTINQALNDFLNNPKNFIKTNTEYAKSYYMLEGFDFFIDKTFDSISILPKYAKNSNLKGINMYNWAGAIIKTGNSWNDEFSDLNKYSSKLVKALCDYIPEVDNDGNWLEAKLNFNSFNSVIGKVLDWISYGENVPSYIKEEARKGLLTDWNKIIKEYKNNVKDVDIISNKLNSIMSIIYGKRDNGSNYLSDEIRDCFSSQIRNLARTKYLVYRPETVNGTSKIGEELLKESFYNKQNAALREKIKSRIYFYRKNQDELTRILDKYKIKITKDSVGGTITFLSNAGHGLQGKYDRTINVKYDTQTKRYIFSDSEMPIGESNNKYIEDLAVELGIIPYLPDNYNDIINSLHIADNQNLFGVLLNPIAVTLTGSIKDNNGVVLFNAYNPKTGDKDLVNLWRYSQSFSNMANFLGVSFGAEELTVYKNAEGNNLPATQLRSSINDIKEILNDVALGRLKDLKIRSSIHSRSGITSIFNQYNDLVKIPGLISDVYTRGDLLINQKSKDSAGYGVAEVAYLSAVKDCYELLLDPNNVNGEIRLQSITHADKKTHFLIGYKTGNMHLMCNGKRATLKDLLISLTGHGKYNKADAKRAIYGHIRKYNSDRTLSQINQMATRFSIVLNNLKRSNSAAWADFKINFIGLDRNILPTYDQARESLLQIDAFLSKFKNKKDLQKVFRDANIDLIDDYDYIVWKNGLHANETIFNFLEVYSNPDTSYFDDYLKVHENYDIKKMIESGLVLSKDRDNSFNELFKKYKTDLYSDWFDDTSDEMDFFRVLDRNGNKVRVGLDNINTYLPINIEGINHDYKVEINPFFEVYRAADLLFSPQLNDALYGVVTGFEVKSAKKRNFDISFKDLTSNDLNKRNKARAFMQRAESERAIMQAKRTVIGGATRFGWTYGRQDSIGQITKIAVMDDVNGALSNINGIQTSDKTADGAGLSLPYQAILESNSSKDLATGKDKKTIFNYTDPETGVMTELKWAVFMITNEQRRDYKRDKDLNLEEAFRKMTNIELSDDDLEGFDFANYYSPNGDIKDDYKLNEYIYKYDNESGEHYRLEKIVRNDNNNFTAFWINVNENGIPKTKNQIEPKFTLNNLYDLDQILGGGYTESFDPISKRLVFSNTNNELITKIICDDIYKIRNWKDKFIGYLVNKSAIKVGARNVNKSNICSIVNANEKLAYFDICNNYGGVQMNQDHNLDEATVTEMSQVISSLIQRGNAFNIVNMMYEDIGKVALDAINRIENANASTDKNEIFIIIGHALMDTFQSGNKNTIGLTRAFINRFEQLLKSGKKNIEFTLPLSAETITPGFFATVGAMLNKRGIKRKYAGFGGYQCPSHNIMRHYRYNNGNLNYVEISNMIRPYVKNGLFKNIDEAFDDPKLTINHGIASIINWDNLRSQAAFKLNEDELDSYEQYIENIKNKTIGIDGTIDSYILNSKETGPTKIIVGSDQDYATFRFAKENNLIRYSFVSKNPFVKALNKEGISKLWLEDTVILANKKTGTWNILKIETEDDLDDIRNYTNLNDFDVFNYTIKPRELASGSSWFEISKTFRSRKDPNFKTKVTERHCIEDLESVRAARYLMRLAEMKDQSKDISDEKKQIIIRQFRRINTKNIKGDLDENKVIEIINNRDKNKNNLLALNKAIVNILVRSDLNSLSKIRNNGNIALLDNFGFFKEQKNNPDLIPDSEEITVDRYWKKSAEIIIGLKNAKQYMLQHGDTLNSIYRNGPELFFEKRLKEKYKDIKQLIDDDPDGLNSMLVDAVGYTKDGKPIIFTLDRSDEGVVYGNLGKDSNFSKDNDGTIWYQNSEELGKIEGADFYKSLGGRYDYVVVKDLKTIKDFQNSNFIDFVQFRKLDDDWEVIEEEADKEKDKYDRKIETMAKQLAESFTLQLQYVGARIPAQSMQSFMDLEVIDFIDSDINEIYVPKQLTWLQGSDYDIDKLYILGYEVDNFGKLYMPTNLAKRSGTYGLNYDNLLLLPIPSGTTWAVDQQNGINVDRFVKFNNKKLDYYDAIKYILENRTENNRISGNYANGIVKLLNEHDGTRLEGNRKTGALKNIVARKLREVCQDASTQVDSQYPIDMDEAKDAASKNDSEANFMSWNSPTMKFELQFQNMVGKTVIATVAVSIKSYFALLESFQNKIAEITNKINKGIAFDPDEIINIVNELLDITFEGNNGKLLTLTNLDFSELVKAINRNSLGSGEFPISDIGNNSIQNLIKRKYIKDGYIQLLDLINDLDEYSNRNYIDATKDEIKWAGLDAALSLSGLLSAATDNAKELILVKLNATSEFADLYSAGLVNGMSFGEVADIMTSKAFNIVAKYSRTNLFDKNSYNFQTRNAIDFILDNDDLKGFPPGLLEAFLNSREVIDLIFKEDGSKSNFRQDPLVDFSTITGTEDPKAQYTIIINKSDSILSKAIKQEILRAFRDKEHGRELIDLLMNYLKKKAVKPAVNMTINPEDINDEPDENDLDFDGFDDQMDIEDDSEAISSYSRYNWTNISADNYKDIYKYLKHYVIPKTESIIAMGSDADTELDKLRTAVQLINIADELKMNGKLCGINQGVKNNRITEANWVNDVNRFVNQRYYNYGKKYDFIPFDIIKFVSDKDYKEVQIKQYDLVKSSVNILNSISSVKHFNAMLTFVKLNRDITSRATSINFARALNNEVLMSGVKNNEKTKVNGIPYWQTLKLSVNSLKVIDRFSRDVLILNWLKQLKSSETSFFVPAGNGYYYGKIFIPTNESGVSMDLTTQDGLLTFKRLMDFYIIPKLKQIFNNENRKNEFLSRMTLNVYKDKLSEKTKTYTALDTKTTNIENDAIALRIYDNMVHDFKDIMDMTTDGIDSKLSRNEKLNIGNWKLKDLFFMYNLLQNKDGFGKNSYTRIFEDLIGAGKDVDLINNYYNWLANRDSNYGDFTGLEYNINNLKFLIAINSPSDSYKVNASEIEINGQKVIQISKINYNPNDLTSDDLFGFAADYFGFGTKHENTGIDIRKVVDAPVITTVPAEIMDVFKKYFKNIGGDVKFYNGDSGRKGNADGYVDSNGTIWINLDKNKDVADLSKVMLHEYMHIICAALKYNENTRLTYYDLLNKIKDYITDSHNKNYIWLKNITDTYRANGVYGSGLYEEVLIKLIEQAFTQSSVYDSLKNVDLNMENLAKHVASIVSELFGGQNANFKNEKAKDVINSPIQNLLSYMVSGIKELNSNNSSDWSSSMIASSKIATAKRLLFRKMLNDNDDINFIGC